MAWSVGGQQNASYFLLRAAINHLNCTYLGPFFILREFLKRAFKPYADLLSRYNTFWVLQPMKYSPAHILDKPLKLNGLTTIYETGAAFVSGIGREKGAINSKDLI